MPSPSVPRAQPNDGLEVAVDQAISACGGDLRATIRALVVANDYLETEVTELMKRSATPMRAAGLPAIPAETADRSRGRRPPGTAGRYETVASIDFCCTTGLLPAFPHVTLR